MTEKDKAGADHTPAWVKNSRKARWSIVVGVALLTVIVFIASRYVSVLQVCGDQVTFEGTTVKHICEPYAVEDLAPVLVLIGVLLLPDLSELALPGGLRLKFRLEQQEQQTERLKTEVERIEQQLNITTTQSQLINFQIARAEERLAEEVERKPTEPDSESDDAPSGSGRQAEVATADEQLIDMWSRLEPWTVVGGDSEQSPALRAWLETPPANRDQLTLPARTRSITDRLASDGSLKSLLSNAAFGSEQLAQIKEWATDHRDELNLVRRVRNDVAHPPHAWDSEEIDRVFGVGEDLLRLLERAVAPHDAAEPQETPEARNAEGAASEGPESSM